MPTKLAIRTAEAGGLALLLVIVLASPGTASEGPLDGRDGRPSGSRDRAHHLFPNGNLFEGMAHPRRFGIGEALPFLDVGASGGTKPAAGEAPERPFRTRSLAGRTLGLTGRFLAGTAAGGYFLWWRKRELVDFDTWNEGWFDADTYTGGADKASHFVLGYIGGRLLQGAYEKLGHPPDRARLLSAGTIAAAALLVEVGDGITGFRFSWEDAVITVAGSVAGALIDRACLSDTIGFRTGRVPTWVPNDPRVVTAESVSYHFEVYTLDMHPSGLLPRLGMKPGPARFFLLSLTYSTRGYGFVREEFRERNVGLEAGLNLPEVLKALGVKEDSAVGGPILWVLRYFRVPFTAIGFRYDLNHRRILGPDGGEAYRP